MRIIICGAGQVGFSIAKYLSSEAHEITIIEQNAEQARRVSDSLDVRSVIGHASHPGILQNAGANDCDLIIAVTSSDEVNMITCQLAHTLFNIPTKVARIRHQGYMDPEWASVYGRQHLPIDVIISPEQEVARSIFRRLEMPGSFENIAMCDERLRLVGMKSREFVSFQQPALKQLPAMIEGVKAPIVAVVRDGVLQPLESLLQIIPGDEVFVLAPTDEVRKVLLLFGHRQPEARRIVLAGGGNVSVLLTEMLRKTHHDYQLKIIEGDRERAEALANRFEDITILHGDAQSQDMLLEANVPHAETYISLDHDDDKNLLSSLLAKRIGCPRVIALLAAATYEPLVGALDLDVVVNPRELTISRILSRIRRGRIRDVHSLRDGLMEVMEIAVNEGGRFAGKTIKRLNLPGDVHMIGVQSDDKFYPATPDYEMKAGDLLILTSPVESVAKLEKNYLINDQFF